mgnify:CR=1 FL=1
MTESILDSVKAANDVPLDEELFDDELLGLINTSLVDIVQQGYGNRDLYVQNNKPTWNDFFQDSPQMVKNLGISYVQQRVNWLFDTPATGAANSNKTAVLESILFRINASDVFEDA